MEHNNKILSRSVVQDMINFSKKNIEKIRMSYYLQRMDYFTIIVRVLILGHLLKWKILLEKFWKR